MSSNLLSGSEFRNRGTGDASGGTDANDCSSGGGTGDDSRLSGAGLFSPNGGAGAASAAAGDGDASSQFGTGDAQSGTGAGDSPSRSGAGADSGNTGDVEAGTGAGADPPPPPPKWDASGASTTRPEGGTPRGGAVDEGSSVCRGVQRAPLEEVGVCGREEQQKGQDHQGGSPSVRSGGGGGKPLSPLAKKCVGGCDDRSPRQYWRRRRYRRREALWRITEVQRCAYCGRVPYSADQDVECYRTEYTEGGEVERVEARVEGVQTCGNVNLCPSCAVEPRRERAEMIDEAIENHRAAGGGVLELLLTLKHGTEHSLQKQIDAMRAGWDAITRSWGGRKLRDRMGIEGYYWANEAPWNAVNGWHVHRHGVFLVEEPLSREEIGECKTEMYDLYRKAVMEAGMPCPSKEQQGLRPLDRSGEGEMGFGTYATKTESRGETRCDGLASLRSEVGKEVSRGDEKEGRKGLMPFEILDRVGACHRRYDAVQRELRRIRGAGGETKWKEMGLAKVRKEMSIWAPLWREYEQVVEGETMMQSSKNFEEKFCSSEEDEEDESGGVEEEEEMVGTVPPHLYRHLTRFRGGVAGLLETIEGDGRIERSGNRITAIGRGEPVDFEELIDALRLDWWLAEDSAPVAEARSVESNT